MKNVKLLFIMVLGVFLFVGCSGADASDRITASLNELNVPEVSDFDDELSFFEAKLDYFESIVEILTSEALEPDADAEVILLEIEALLELIENEAENYRQFIGGNFEQHCYEDGGTIVEEEYGRWCDTDSDSLNQQRRSRVWDRLFSIVPQTMSVEYVLYDDLEDFDKMLNELEAKIGEFENELDNRLTYAEANETEAWDLLYQGILQWGYWEDLTTDFGDLVQQIEAIGISIELNPHVPTDRHRRLERLHNRLVSRIQNTFVTS